VKGVVAKSNDPATIVVAEDEVLVRLMVADHLRAQGFKVLEAASAQEAISILASVPDIRVIVTDMHMLGPQDGIELANYVRAHHPRIAMLLASAHPPAAVEQSPFDAFFTKPYNLEAIAAWIKRRLPSPALRTSRSIAAS
jgi:CheY-like chemotaxis protein